jgi:hypothetical protein
MDASKSNGTGADSGEETPVSERNNTGLLLELQSLFKAECIGEGRDTEREASPKNSPKFSIHFHVYICRYFDKRILPSPTTNDHHKFLA